MADIYNNAYLVIAASQAADSSFGFIDRRDEGTDERAEDEIGPPIPTRNWTRSTLAASNLTKIGRIMSLADSTISEVFAKLLPGAGFQDDTARHDDPIAYSPLNRRAWALQENLLARRIVHFTKYEMMWECLECLKCECMEMDSTPTASSVRTGIMRRAQYATGLRYGDKGDRYLMWRNLLLHYGGLELSKQSDRLPALSGLAKF